MNKKITNKDKEDWEDFLKSKEKIPNKDLVFKKSIRHENIKKIDLNNKICHTLASSNDLIINPPQLKQNPPNKSRR